MSDDELTRTTTQDLLDAMRADMAAIKRSRFGLRVERFPDPNERIRIEGDGWSAECRIRNVEFEEDESNLFEPIGRTFTVLSEQRTIMRIGSYTREITGNEVVTFLDRVEAPR